ncbi:RNA polymerase-associated protein RTF1-like, partial [Trifolium medium]|nr:RNA polymerase-associated protein RTF1-like [Trifolium medium]
MVEKSKDIVEDNKPSWFGCETCHIWQGEGKCLESVERRWFLDSGCLRHMTGDRSLFIEFTPKKKGFVTYGDDNQGAILVE